jgi:hypothetical protein
VCCGATFRAAYGNDIIFQKARLVEKHVPLASSEEVWGARPTPEEAVVLEGGTSVRGI